ncbi:hypothetical protein DF039_34660 [Burkholderia cenocepacia]|nr:hypothetical protein DF039_34660 [Burkholderia cenocepacia]
MAVLGQLRFRLRTTERHAQAIQSRCSEWFHARMLRQFAMLLDTVENERGSALQLDRLTIDVGEIALSRFEREMSERVLAELTRQLTAYPSSHRRDDTQDMCAAALPPPMTVSGHSDPDRFWQLLRYLDTGYATEPAAWRGAYERTHWLVDTLESGTSVSLMPRVEIALRCLQPDALRRLVTTFPVSALATLIRWLVAPARLPIVTPLDGSMWLPLAALIALQQNPAGASAYEFCMATQQRDTEPDVRNDPPEPGAGHPAAPEAALNVWFVALLSRPLSVPLRAHVAVWLDTPIDAQTTATRLGMVSPQVREQWHAGSGAVENTPLPRPSDVGELATPWRVPNAGVVLLWPFLPRLFDSLGLLDDGRFVDEGARWQAVGCLDWLAWGEPELAEWRMPASRLLCGLPWDGPFESHPIPGEWQIQLDAWLTGRFAGVAHLSRCRAGDLRAFFLQRAGTLVEVDDRLTLMLEPDAADVMLQAVPWPLTSVALPWLASPLAIRWGVP